MIQRYCNECGGRITEGQSHSHDEAGLKAMKANPMLALLINDDGTMDRTAPIILGGGEKV